MSGKSKKERLAAIIIGLIMIFSLGGFALSSVVYMQPSGEEQPALAGVVEHVLTPQERISVLRSGRVLIEDFYQQNCTECLALNGMLASFAESFQEYALLEISPANETLVQMIGAGGQIRDIPLNTSQDELFSMFCELAIIQPKECLLREF